MHPHPFCSPAYIEILEIRIAPAAVAAITLSSLGGANGFKLSGAADNDNAGVAVSAAGDINGDGFGDVIVGAFSADEGSNDRGAAYLIFGKPGGFPDSLPLGTLAASDGFKLIGYSDSSNTGGAVGAAGDVNGDGFDDLIIGASQEDFGGTNLGGAYVVFGKAGGFGTSLDLSTLNLPTGFVIIGPEDNDDAGISVSAAGDINGDGFTDVIVGATRADEGGSNRGAAYVVFGKRGGFDQIVFLDTLDGSNGFKLSGAADGDQTGRSVNAAGDLNGDGFDDLVVGAPFADVGSNSSGTAYVLYGKAGGFGASVALGTLDGANGSRLIGALLGDDAGFSASAAGDVNGDGFDDLIVGAYGADDSGVSSGAACVVFGKAGGFGASMSLGSLNGSNGFRLLGVAEFDTAGRSVSAAGDVNGDGFDDLIVGASDADEGSERRGAAYVFFGKADSFTATVGLGTLNGNNGFKLSGAADYDYAGRAVSGAGDVNGDGFADVIIGAQNADEGGDNRGAAYVVFGFGTADVTPSINGKSATFTDWDGDLVTIKATKGPLTAAQFHLSSPNPLTGGAHLIAIDFTGVTDGTGLTITAKRGPMGGDGLVNVGTLDARSAALGKVSIDGDLQQLDADAVAGLTVYSLGQFAGDDLHGGPLRSDILGKLGALTVKTTASHVTLAAQTFGAIKAQRLDDVRLFAAGVANPNSVANALAIKSLTVSADVSHSRILAGYDATGAAFNADVAIGAVKVLGQWIASDLVAGVRAGDDGLFATGDTNETLVPLGNATIAKIASITIGGAVVGTLDDRRDGFGFAAQEIGSLTIGKAKVPLTKKPGNDLAPLVLAITGDVRVREVAV